ncbi:MAG: 5'/3'-nucleotidase SurE [Treponema sp.]|nr:5'/3'-nucleotidase SurE [Treponema sp.]
MFKILLTNDDGISSQGIRLLAKALRDKGHKVYLVAPDINRSGSSHGIEFLNKPLKFTVIEEDTWSCSGSPADCIITALLGGIDEICISTDSSSFNMEKAPDLILSGINAGANLGTDIIYSGTAAAARQGSFFGIPSVALSLVENDLPRQWDSVIHYVAENLVSLMGYWKAGTFVNVNFPNIDKKPSSLVLTFPSLRCYNDRIVTFFSPEGDKYCFANPGKVDNIPEEGSDWAEILKDNATISVVISQPVISN